MHALQNRLIITMIGNAPSLQDIVLDSVPDTVCLHCDEELPEEEEEEESMQLVLEYYEVGSTCYCCERPVKFTCAANPDSILLLHELLLESGLQFLCSRCAVSNKNGR